jgi:transcriptional regulator with GAF, ATPase, and Fis domain
MSEADVATELERIRKERDLYAGLLNLNLERDPEPFLRSALELVSGIVGATEGYLELFGDGVADNRWSHAVGFSSDELESIRASVSSGIIAEAVASEKVVLTPSALLDPRFKDRLSVQRSKIDAELCAPIGRDPPRGVLYMQSASMGVFNRDAVARVELFANHLAPLVNEYLRRRRSQGHDLAAELRTKLGAEDFVGSSRALAEALREVELVAPLEVGVLLHGETGTGKTQLARLIHRNSPRAGGPFVELNCAALPEQLIESELFGAAPGAHSTATRRVEGKVAAAEDGTLLLDEVSELSLPAQAKLLQLLQAKEYYPLGASKPVKTDTRIIAATNVDLAQAVSDKRFREDLYYRLQVITVRVPSLAERAEDAVPLARHFCERALRTHKLPHVELSPGAQRAIENAEWPGNVRQLAHAVEAATIRAAAQRLQRVEASQLFAGAAPGDGAALTFQEETRRFQTQLLKRVLEAEDWNVSAAARRLDLTRAHVYNLIKSFGLQR